MLRCASGKEVLQGVTVGSSKPMASHGLGRSEVARSWKPAPRKRQAQGCTPPPPTTSREKPRRLLCERQVHERSYNTSTLPKCATNICTRLRQQCHEDKKNAALQIQQGRRASLFQRAPSLVPQMHDLSLFRDRTVTPTDSLQAALGHPYSAASRRAEDISAAPPTASASLQRRRAR